MPTLPIKIASGVAVVGAIGGGGIYGIYKLNDTTNSVENYLKDNNLKPVASTETAFWKKVLETYKLEKTTETSIKKGEITNQDEIKAWCSSNLSKEIKSKEDPLFKKASKWCVEYKTIKESLGGDSKFETTPATLDGKYAGLDPEIKPAIEKIEITQSAHQNGHKIKKWCEENANRSFTEDNKAHTENIKKICLKANGA